MPFMPLPAYGLPMQANNGVCNDGRVDLKHTLQERVYVNVTCDLGTDCADCGPWTPSGPVSW